MKILKEGKLPVILPITYLGSCYNCQCQIEVEKSELQIKNGSSFTYPCPTKGCNVDISLSENLMYHVLHSGPRHPKF